jgi:hypothetical protein
VDPSGLYAQVTVEQVSVDGKDITIKIPIQFTGPGATPDVIKKIIEGIEKKWTGKFGCYYVKVHVVVREGAVDPNRKDNNVIDIPAGDGRPWVNHNGNDKNGILFGTANSGTWFAGIGGNMAGHEAGHLLGLDDQYDDDADGISHPRPGWENNVMADYNMPVQERNIQMILDGKSDAISITTVASKRKPPSTPSNCKPWNVHGKLGLSGR